MGGWVKLLKEDMLSAAETKSDTDKSEFVNILKMRKLLSQVREFIRESACVDT